MTSPPSPCQTRPWGRARRRMNNLSPFARLAVGGKGNDGHERKEMEDCQVYWYHLLQSL